MLLPSPQRTDCSAHASSAHRCASLRFTPAASDGCGHPDGDKDDPQDKPCYNLKTFRVLISGAGLFRKTSDEKLQYLRECDEESTSDEEGSLQTTDDYDSADDSASDEPAAQ